jgi:ZIP family zinc transporter
VIASLPGIGTLGAEFLAATGGEMACFGSPDRLAAFAGLAPAPWDSGRSLHAEGRGLGLVLLAAVFLANVPESLGSVGAMPEEGRSRGYIIGVWTTVGVVCVLATVAGYALLGGLSPGWVSAILALAAGGILALLADTMFPEAFEHGGRWVALATAVGFACAFLLSELTGSA